MLREPDIRPERRRPPQRSLRQEYEEYILQRIEDFKDQISRDELLTIADEAVRELEINPAEQLVLTEVVMLEHVDRAIVQRLNLPPFRRWRNRHVRLRRAQREPTHWGFSRTSPLADLGAWDAVDGAALVVGARGIPVSLYFAAHDWSIMFVEREGHAVEAAEARAAAEALARDYEGCVVLPGSGWFPDVRAALVVVDPVCLTGLDPETVNMFFANLDASTVSGGVHCIMPMDDDVVLLEAQTFRSRYATWNLERYHARAQPEWLIAVKR